MQAKAAAAGRLGGSAVPSEHRVGVALGRRQSGTLAPTAMERYSPRMIGFRGLPRGPNNGPECSGVCMSCVVGGLLFGSAQCCSASANDWSLGCRAAVFPCEIGDGLCSLNMKSGSLPQTFTRLTRSGLAPKHHFLFRLTDISFPSSLLFNHQATTSHVSYNYPISYIYPRDVSSLILAFPTPTCQGFVLSVHSRCQSCDVSARTGNRHTVPKHTITAAKLQYHYCTWKKANQRRSWRDRLRAGWGWFS